MNPLAASSAEMGGTTIEIGCKNVQKSSLDTESESK